MEKVLSWEAHLLALLPQHFPRAFCVEDASGRAEGESQLAAPSPTNFAFWKHCLWLGVAVSPAGPAAGSRTAWAPRLPQRAGV